MKLKRASTYTVYSGRRAVAERDACTPAQAVTDYLRRRGCGSDEISRVGCSELAWRGAVFTARKTSEVS
jgi:hypothetical protein